MMSDEDIDFFANMMPEWLGRTPEEGRKKAQEWKKMRAEADEEKQKRLKEEIDAFIDKVYDAIGRTEIYT